MYNNDKPNSIFNYQEIGQISPDYINELPSTTDQYFELNVIQNGIIFPYFMKKCCKKYKKGKRCKKCPNQ